MTHLKWNMFQMYLLKENFYQSGRSELDKTDAFHFKVCVQSL